MVGPRLQIRVVTSPIRIMQALSRGIDRPRKFGMHQKRQSGLCYMRERSAQIFLAYHGEFFDAGMHKETLEPQHSGPRERLYFVLIVFDNSTPRAPVNSAFALCRQPLGL